MSSVETESALLGALVISPDNWGLLSSLDTELLSIAVNKRLLETYKETYRVHKTLDFAVLSPSLQGDEKNYLARYIQECPNAESAKEYIRALQQEKNRSKIRDKAHKILQNSNGIFRPGDVQGLAGEIVSLCNLGDVRYPDYHEESVREYESAGERGNQILWGIPSLDDLVGAIPRSTLTVVGGKTNHGKTAFSLSTTARLLQESKKIIYNGFENLNQTWKKLAAMMSSTPLDMFIKPWMFTNNERADSLNKLNDVRKFTNSLKILPGVDVFELGKYVREFKPDVVIVDYIQRYARKHRNNKMNLHDNIGHIMSDLQDLALQNNCAMIVLSQITRQSADSRGRKPELEDLKESGEIENIADVVLLLWWQWKENYKKRPTNAHPDEYTIIVGKNKMGRVDEVKARFNQETTYIGAW